MNYELIGKTINQLGMTYEPALRGTVFVIEPIPCYNSCPLGLYDSDSNTIVLPPGFNKSVLIHEIGHRIGDYYYGELSEKFAEDFRKKFDFLYQKV